MKGRGTWGTHLLALVVAFVAVSTASETWPQTFRQAPNVIPLSMRMPHSGFNRLLISVTVCEPGTKRCATIDDVMVDTGSTGLRLEASALPPTVRLPPVIGPDDSPLAECVRFVHANAWGDLFRADVHLGGMIAADLPLQIIGAGLRHQAASCPMPDTPPTSNGTLGIGSHLTDCPGDCVQSIAYPTVFSCGATACVPIQGHVDAAYRLPNPVSLFALHNNGVVVDLPAAPEGGVDAVNGTLTFGVGTAANNALGDARLLRLDGAGGFTTIYDGHPYRGSYIDSGTQTYILPDLDMPRCKERPWEFCVAPARRLTATMVASDGTSIAMPFEVGHYEDIRARRSGASASIAVSSSQPTDPFVWGAPFFLGKRIYVVMDGKGLPDAPGILGPLYGFQ